MRESGKTTQSSEEEMKRHVDNDVCAINWEGNPECGEEMTDLPWNPVEELLTMPEGSRSSVEEANTALSSMLMGLGAAGTIATLILFVKQEVALNRQQSRKVLSLAVALVLAFSFHARVHTCQQSRQVRSSTTYQRCVSSRSM